jgi:RNA-splicing ligase RtcB
MPFVYKHVASCPTAITARATVGIEFRRSHVLLDEIPSAYKDIDEVMEHASPFGLRAAHSSTTPSPVSGRF